MYKILKVVDLLGFQLSRIILMWDWITKAIRHEIGPNGSILTQLVKVAEVLASGDSSIRACDLSALSHKYFCHVLLIHCACQCVPAIHNSVCCLPFFPSGPELVFLFLKM